MKIQHILLTTDLSEEARRAFAPVQELAQQRGARVTVLHVVPTLTIAPHGAPLAPRVSSPDTEDDVRHARETLEAQLRDLGGDLNWGADVIAAEDIGAAIAGHATEVGADLIALSTHGRSGLRRLVLGSVAEQVLRHSRTPVLCFPPAR